MRRVCLFFLATIIFFPSFSNSNEFFEKLQKGKVIEISVTPMGDHWEYADGYHEITIYKSGQIYEAELFQKGVRIKIELSEKELRDILFFVTHWNPGKDTDTRSMIYDQVKIKVGMQKEKFKTIQNSDIEIIRKYFSNTSSDE